MKPGRPSHSPARRGFVGALGGLGALASTGLRPLAAGPGPLLAPLAVAPVLAPDDARAADLPRAARVPIETWAALPSASGARLSPDGRRLAVITAANGRRAFGLWDLDGKDKPLTFPTGEGEPAWIAWKSPTRAIAALRIVSRRGPLERTLDTRLVALDALTGKVLELVQSNRADWEPQIQDRVLGFLPDDPDHLLLELAAIERRVGAAPSAATRRERIEHPEVVAVDLRDGGTRTVERGHGLINHWIAAPDGTVRLGWAYQRDRSLSLLARAAPGAPWETIETLPLNTGQEFEPIAFVDGHADRLWVRSNRETGRAAIVEYDLGARRVLRVAAQSASDDVSALVRGGRLVGWEGDGATRWLDAGWAADAKLLEGALRGSEHAIVDRSADGQRALVSVTRGNAPRGYFLLAREDGKPVLDPVTDAVPDLPAERFGVTEVTHYTARDGLTIEALVTLPPGRAAGDGPIPFVVLPHGGPSAHDEPGYDYWVQFLVNQGWGVLQPQFRGSTGHGRDFLVAGYRQWGLAMQDDITDGTRWLVERRLADPARIAIVGASYGGYAALMGVAREPGLYRCAAAIAPVTDLVRLVDDQADYIFGDLNLPQVGDRRRLDATSPLRLVDRIGAPVLLVHGRQDATVPVAHSELMGAALERAGKPVTTVLLDDADHNFQRVPDRVALLTLLESFLGAWLR
ncbi:S9 family peptidase [Derxia gummosa]|uniref:S9 family peptidase n=1 Tax=Derxia gummosa DSM 723 TaxID=1121388 RepID=A0A8B6X3Z9_9BURK|nr:prolyl oligopeptidase family serine peptidase [Derxia gummosa]